jgi:hypothetical protein
LTTATVRVSGGGFDAYSFAGQYGPGDACGYGNNYTRSVAAYIIGLRCCDP